jgi:phenylalanine-4-hydroxylase
MNTLTHIIHEGAGHAPIIANQNMRNIRRFGEMGCKAFLRTKITKCMKLSTLLIEEETATTTIDAEKQLKIYKLWANSQRCSNTQPALVDGWYGLIGTVENPKIYGAGLLSLYWRVRLYDGSEENPI